MVKKISEEIRGAFQKLESACDLSSLEGEIKESYDNLKSLQIQEPEEEEERSMFEQ